MSRRSTLPSRRMGSASFGTSPRSAHASHTANSTCHHKSTLRCADHISLMRGLVYRSIMGIGDRGSGVGGRYFQLQDFRLLRAMRVLLVRAAFGLLACGV